MRPGLGDRVAQRTPQAVSPVPAGSLGAIAMPAEGGQQSTFRERGVRALRNHWLTVIRYVAALMVVIHHMIFLRELGPGHFAYEVNRSGFSGVTLFFILSGIVLSMSYHDRIKSGGSILSFYWARLTRIVPLWFIVSLPLFVRTGFNGEHLLSYVTFTQAWATDDAAVWAYLAVAWTLSVEMFFYLVFPLLAIIGKFLSRWKLAGPVFLLVGLGIAIGGALYYELRGATGELKGEFGHYRMLYHFPPMRLGDFITGIGLFYLFKDFKILRHGWWACIALGLAATIVVIYRTDEELWAWDAAFIGPFALLLFGLLCAPSSLTERTPKLLILLGEASFALYLIHQYYVIPNFQNFYGPPTENMLAAGITVTVIATCLSIGLFMAFERPVMHLLRNPGRIFARKRRNDDEALAETPPARGTDPAPGTQA